MQNINYIREISADKKKGNLNKIKIKNQKEHLISFKIRDWQFQDQKDGMVNNKEKIKS